MGLVLSVVSSIEFCPCGCSIESSVLCGSSVESKVVYEVDGLHNVHVVFCK